MKTIELDDNTIAEIAKLREQLVAIEEESKRLGQPLPKRTFELDDASLMAQFFTYGAMTWLQQMQAVKRAAEAFGEIMSRAGTRNVDDVIAVLGLGKDFLDEDCGDPTCAVHHPPEPLAPRGGAARRKVH